MAAFSNASPSEESALAFAGQQFQRRVDNLAGWLLSGPRWKVKALAAILTLTLLRAFPSYDALRWPYVQATWRNVEPLLEHPLTNPAALPQAAVDARLRNLAFRRTVLVVARCLRLGETGLLILFAAAGIASLYGVLAIVDSVVSRKSALFVCLAAACAWPGEAAFHDLRGGYFDAVALAFLIGALWTPWPPAAACCIFFASWTDERALIASAFVLLLAAARGASRAKLLAAPFAWAAYLATRYMLASAESIPTTSGDIGLATLRQQANAIPLGVWTGLGGCWLLLMGALCSAIVRRRYALAASFCAILAVLIASGMAITDITRTVAYCFPAVPASLALLAQSEPRDRIEKLAATSAWLSFIFPTYYVQGSTGFWWLYPLPLQIVRWLTAK
jgi:hypothetical protein